MRPCSGGGGGGDLTLLTCTGYYVRRTDVLLLMAAVLILAAGTEASFTGSGVLVVTNRTSQPIGHRALNAVRSKVLILITLDSYPFILISFKFNFM